ncbi:hypothetical protein [Nannocystis punicea]|uniref:Uncharacterized protein n=1 Tax=Nannocystis punicea TaxID=2995304 RepID=A0ABY7GX45_9BACT|nr:hypothetical protein [Nannocystis poenicansa]WAS91542.1 hypothetical protein O0S08_35615 [Nannocystis poenicansa]
MFERINADPSRWHNIVPIPLDAPGSKFSDAVCDAAIAAGEAHGSWLLNLVPRQMVCARLASDAAQFASDEGMVATPSFFTGEGIIRPGDVESVLGFHPFK